MVRFQDFEKFTGRWGRSHEGFTCRSIAFDTFRYCERNGLGIPESKNETSETIFPLDLSFKKTAMVVRNPGSNCLSGANNKSHRRRAEFCSSMSRCHSGLPSSSISIPVISNVPVAPV